jgi:hypothetical protein
LTALAIAVLAAAGYPAASRLGSGAGVPQRCAEGFLLATGFSALWLLVLSELHLLWSRSAIVCGLILLAAAGFRRRRDLVSLNPSSMLISSPVAIVVAAIVTAWHAAFATLIPLSEWDFLAVWGLKGRWFFAQRAIDWDILKRPDLLFSHPDYPPLLPLTYDAVALLSGSWEPRQIGLITTAFGLAALVVAFSMLPRAGEGLVELAVATTLALVAFSNRIGLAEAPLIAFTAASLLYIRRGVVENNSRLLFAGSLFLGMAAWTKNEGAALCVVVVLAVLLSTARNRYRDWLSLVPVLPLAMAWPILLTLHGLPVHHAPGTVAERVGPVLRDVRRWAPALIHDLEKPFFWLAIVAMLAFSGIAAIRAERFLLLAIAGQITAILVAMIVLYLDAPEHLVPELAFSWERLTHQVALPAACLAVLASHHRSWSIDPSTARTAVVIAPESS